jgi:signal transduction histidine kinase
MPLIFVIEDNETLRENTAMLLNFHGFETMSFESGEPAIVKLGTNRPDLVLCDVVMPTMSGYDILSHFRAQAETAAIPFVFMSALAEQDQIRKGMIQGADDYLTKPFSATTLLATVRARIKHAENIRRLFHIQSQQPLDARKLNSMPHELRTPLNGIIGGIEILRESLAGHPESLELVDIISTSADRLERTLLNYLFYISITSGRHQCPDPEQFDLAQRVESVVNEVATRYLRRNDLMLNFQRNPVKLCPVCFHRIVSELVDNAFKFSSSCQMVGVACGWSDQAQAWTVRIRDQGIGMSGENIGRISAFSQFDRETHEQQGMGLGLALSMALACGHGWKVSLNPSTSLSGVDAELLIPLESSRHPSCVCPDYFSRMGVSI